ncbi:MAG: hypothetical protein EOM55_02140 [Clostridia bacterium]|nr:hypothetical protein [Clostridia bacterium]
MNFQFLSMLGAFEFFNGIMPYMKEIFVAIFFGYILYFAFIGVSFIINFVQKLFGMLAGIEEMSLDTSATYGGSNDDLIVGVLKNTNVQIVFWSILGVCIVLLVVFTIVAVIKAEFSLKYSSKAPIITRALTSFANFIMIPVIFIVGIYATSQLLNVVSKVFGEGADDSMAFKCFLVGSSGANRARNDKAFADYLRGGAWLKSAYQERNPFKNCSTQETVAKKVDDIFAGKVGSDGKKLSEILTGEISGKGVDQVYTNVVKLVEYNYTYRYTNMDTTYVDWHVSLIDYPDFTNGINILNINIVNYFYDFSSFNYILALGSAIIIGWSMLTVCLLLFKRILEMLILFLLAPVMTAVAPLDSGNAEKKLRGEFLKRLLAVIGPVFAYNLFFIIIGIFGSLSPFTGGKTNVIFGLVMNKIVLGVFDIMFQIAVIIVGLDLLKTANSLFTSMLGLEDMLGQADANAKKVMGTAGKVALGATALGGLAFKATGTAAKLTGKAAVGIGKGVGATGKAALRGASRLTGYQGQVKNEKELEQEEEILSQAYEKGDDEAVKISTERIGNIKAKLDKVPKNRRDDYKIWSSKQKIKDIKRRPTGSLEDSYANDDLIAEEEAKVSGLKQERETAKQERRENRKEKFDASFVGRKLGDLKQGKFLLKDVFGASAGSMRDRLLESLGGLTNESGQAAINLIMNKNGERSSFYKSKEEIADDKKKRDKKETDYSSGKESQLEFLKKGVARERGSEIESESKRLNENLANATKDGVLSEQVAAKKELEKFETKHGITKQAEIMQASINKVSDKSHFENIDKVNDWLKNARKQAEDEATAKTNKELQDQAAANKDVFKESLGETNKLLKESLETQKHENLGINEQSNEQIQLEQMEGLKRAINSGFESLGKILKGEDKKDD